MNGTLGTEHVNVLESNTPSWKLNSELQFTEFNRRLEEDFSSIFGVKPTLNKSIIDTFSEIDPTLAKKWLRRFQHVYQKGSVTFEEIYLGNRFSKRIEFEIRRIKLSNGDYGISAIANDITERRKFEQSLLFGNDVLRSILDYTKSAIWIINREKKLIEFNRAFLSFYRLAFGSEFGISPDFLSEITSAEPRRKWSKHFLRVLNGQAFTIIENFHIDGLHHSFEIECQPLIQNDVVRGAVFFAHDISAQQRQEVVLRSKNQELQKVNSQLDRFVYSASHDLRAPITTAQGLINLIKLDSSPANLERCVDLLNRSIDKLNVAVKEIGDFAYNARIQVVTEKIYLLQIIMDCIHQCAHLPGFVNVKFEVKASADDFVISDIYRLRLILVNLISNAVRFQDVKKDPYVLIHVSGRGHKTNSIEIIDNGIGIQQDHLEKIFDMFYKATPQNSGPGLGLYIAREAINLIGGNIKVHSEFGIGSRFKIDLDHPQL